MNRLFLKITAAFALSVIASCCAHAQDATSLKPPTQQPAQTPAPDQIQDALHGKVLFQSHGEPPIAAEPGNPQAEQAKPSGPELTDAERSAITVTAYDLDVRLAPGTSRFGARAKLTLRNDGTEPLRRIALQISSSLQWESANLVSAEGSTKLELGQHLLDTDADHTGRANEAAILLTSPFAPGQTLTVDTFYSGEITVNTDRLARIGASEQQALAADWDGVVHEYTALRGFGNVLWYPVSSKQVFLGEGAELFQAIGHMEQREQNATFRLRVGVEYRGNPPAAVYFCGRRQALHPVADDPNTPVSITSGFATAEFTAQPLGFRLPSLVIVEHPETMLAPLPETSADHPVESSSSSSSSLSQSTGSATPADPSALTTVPSGAPMLAFESDESTYAEPLANAVETAAPLLQEWLGPNPLSALTVVDHPGQPFEDGPLLLAPVKALVDPSEQPAVVHSLTHAWVQTEQPWMDEGLAQFFAILWAERVNGREGAVAQLNSLLQPLALAEPALEEGKTPPAGQPLISATSEIFFRRKAAAVWFMLRGLVGDKALQSALKAWRTQLPSHGSAEQTAVAFESLLEKTSGKDLNWFFTDWVLHDRGLPELSVVNVTPHALPAGNGHNGGWLVSVTVRNEGGAAAEVPVIIRSGTFSSTSSLRIPAFGSATARVLVEAPPTEVVVNDGSIPELSASKHSRLITASPTLN